MVEGKQWALLNSQNFFVFLLATCVGSPTILLSTKSVLCRVLLAGILTKFTQIFLHMHSLVTSAGTQACLICNIAELRI